MFRFAQSSQIPINDRILIKPTAERAGIAPKLGTTGSQVAGVIQDQAAMFLLARHMAQRAAKVRVTALQVLEQLEFPLDAQT